MECKLHTSRSKSVLLTALSPVPIARSSMRQDSANIGGCVDVWIDGWEGGRKEGEKGGEKMRRILILPLIVQL